jgi:hypothetical protein
MNKLDLRKIPATPDVLSSATACFSAVDDDAASPPSEKTASGSALATSGGCEVLCKSSKNSFTKGVERLIDPITVGSLHFIQSFNRLLPRYVQKRLVTASSKKTPSMGFVVEPYSLFLFYEIADPQLAKSLLPDGFELIKTKVFEHDTPRYYCTLGCFRAHTSAFWGARAEFYIIAKDQKTGLLSWIIIDYDTDTISYDKKNGLRSPNSSRSVVATNYQGMLFVDIQRDDGARKLIADADIRLGHMTELDQRLWLEGNLSVGYGRNLSDNGADIFSLRFEPQEVKSALDIPTTGVNVQANTWYPGLFKDKPAQVACFPYAQHFVSDSPGYSSNLRNKNELLQAVCATNFDKIAVFSARSFKKMFLLGTLASLFVTITLLVMLLI